MFTFSDLNKFSEAKINLMVGEVDDKVNQVDDKVDEVAAKVGDLSSLTTTAKNNVVAAVNEVEAKVEPFVVTLTPTALDFSGTMDKTVGEIYEAWLAGKKVIFRMATAEDAHIDVDVSLVGSNEADLYPSFEAYVIQSGTNLLIWAGTGVTDSGTKNTYSTKVYELTPAT